MNSYTEYRGYSPLHDCEVARLSMADDKGQEFYAIVPVLVGKGWRNARNDALCRIEDAINAGDEPGEVRDIT